MSSRTATACVDKKCIRSNHINNISDISSTPKFQSQVAKSPFRHDGDTQVSALQVWWAKVEDEMVELCLHVGPCLE